MRRFICTVLCLGGVLAGATAADWPGFRGPTADGLAPDVGINKDWSRKPPKLLWQQPLSDNGNAAPAVAGETLYIVDHIGSNDVVRALNTADGQERWRYSYPDAKANRHGFTVSTPLIRDGRVFVFSRTGQALGLRADTGALLWRRALAQEYRGVPPPWNYCMSPVLDDGRLLFCPGGTNAAVVALDPASGRTLWAGGGSAKASYASPVVATLQGRKQYLLYLVPGLCSVDPADGHLFWELPWPTALNKKAPTPVLVGERIFICATEGSTGGLVELVGGQPRVVWQHKQMQEHFPTPIYYHGRIYGSCDPNALICLEPLTGKVLWKKTPFTYASVVGVDDTAIFLAGNTGELIMVDATSPEYKELGRCQPLGGPSWTAPIIAHGRLYVRNKQALACLDLR